MNSSSSLQVFKAQLQNKLNLATTQVLCELVSQVGSLEEEEDNLLGPKLQRMKYLEEVLETLKNKRTRLQNSEDAYFRKEQLLRQAKLRDFQDKYSQHASDFDLRKSSEEWLRSETEGAQKLEIQTRRLRKRLDDLKKNKHCNKTWLKDCTAIQMRLDKKLDLCIKSMVELEKENKKLRDTKISEKSVPTSSETSQLFETNSDTLREEIYLLKQQLQHDFSQEALMALTSEQERLVMQSNHLQEKSQSLSSDTVESKNYSARLKQKIAHRKCEESGKSRSREELVTRVDSQKTFLVELLQRKESAQNKIDTIKNQEPFICKIEQNISELEVASESSAYAKKQFQKIEEEHKKLSTMQQWISSKLDAQQSLAKELAQKTALQANTTAVEEEKVELKRTVRDLSEDLQRRTKSEKKLQNSKIDLNRQLDEIVRDAKGVEERLESRKAERHKTDKEKIALIQQLDQIAHEVETKQKAFMVKSEKGDALEARLQAVEAELGEAHWSYTVEVQANEALKKSVIETVQAMQKKSQLDTE